MEIKEAIELLKYHNQWRRYDGEINKSPKMTDPKKLGIAIDTVISEFENLFISGVVVSEACKGDKPLPYELMPFKCHNCSGEIKKSETEFYCVDYNKSNGEVYKCKNQCTGCWQVQKRFKQ